MSSESTSKITSESQMPRRRFVGLLGAAGAALAMGRSKVFAVDTTSSPATAVAGKLVNGTPAAYGLGETSVSIIWTLNGSARGWVEYGFSKDQLDQNSGGDGMGFVPYDDEVLKVRLANLQPGKRYWWRTVTEPHGSEPGTAREVSKVYTFKTLDPKGMETRFAMWNDTHNNEATLAKLGQVTATVAASAEAPDFMVWNGDAVLRNHDDPAPIPDIYVHPRGGVDLAACAPIYFSRGNHDIRGLWANRVNRYIDYPGGQVDRPYHAIRSGPMAAIFLETGEDKPDRHPSFKGMAAFEGLIAAQARWLEDVIQRPGIKDAPLRVVFCHIPLRWTDEGPQNYFAKPAGFDRFSKRGREAWHASLVKWGAQIIISGHVHRWTYLPATSEFPYAQITGGGPEQERATFIQGHATNRGLDVWATALDGREVQRITLKPYTT